MDSNMQLLITMSIIILHNNCNFSVELIEVDIPGEYVPQNIFHIFTRHFDKYTIFRYNKVFNIL